MHLVSECRCIKPVLAQAAPRKLSLKSSKAPVGHYGQ
jgi:hypothetical protein